jgi:hypothetical protein
LEAGSHLTVFAASHKTTARETLEAAMQPNASVKMSEDGTVEVSY